MIFAIVALSVALGILLGYGWGVTDEKRRWITAYNEQQRKIAAWIARVEAILMKHGLWKERS